VMPGFRFCGCLPYFRAGRHYPLSLQHNRRVAAWASKQSPPQSGILPDWPEEVRSPLGLSTGETL